MPAENKSLMDHLFLQGRDRGPCRKLKGKVLLINLLVNDTKTSRFSEADIARAEEIVGSGVRTLNRLARESGVDLQLSAMTEVMTVHRAFDRNATGTVIEDTRRHFGDVYTLEDAQKRYKQKYGCDEAPIMLLLNRDSLSCTYKTEGNRLFLDELSIVFCGREKPVVSYVHELLHQFGAVDLYTPPFVEEASKRYFPETVMRGREHLAVDDLTKFLIGWTDVMTPDVARFLEETAEVTRERVTNLQRAQEKKYAEGVRATEKAAKKDIKKDKKKGFGRFGKKRK